MCTDDGPSTGVDETTKGNNVEEAQKEGEGREEIRRQEQPVC